MLKKIFFVMLILIGSNLFSMQPLTKLPIIYHEGYEIGNPKQFGNTSFYFPSSREIYQNLLTFGLTKEKFYEHWMVDSSDIHAVHDDKYMEELVNEETVNPNLLKAQKFITGGTILACNLAVKYGWAINLGGGLNLASSTYSCGSCLLSDVAIAIHRFWNENPFTSPQILIIDLSAKQNTSFVEIFKNKIYPSGERIHELNTSIQIFQMYNLRTFHTYDESLKDLITFNIPINHETSGEEYFCELNRHLTGALETIKRNHLAEYSRFYPDLIIYVAGTDLSKTMPKITQEDIIKRDSLVFSLAEQYKIPIVMTLGPSSCQNEGETIFKSILNILKLKKILPQ